MFKIERFRGQPLPYSLGAHEKERPHARAIILRALSYMWRRCRWAMCPAFRGSAVRATRGPEACGCGGHWRGMTSPRS